MATIYTKTTEGQREIETRARRLTPRARSTLILVDGRRSDVELEKLVQHATEALQSLLQAGLVEAVVPVAPAPKEAVSAAAATAEVELESTRRNAVRAINDLLGPQADALALRLERATNSEELRAALERAVAYIANARGGGAAAQFAAKFLVGGPTE